MRRPSILIVAITLGLTVAACRSAATPGWTYAPAPSATSPPSASAGPASPAAGAPSAGPAGGGTSIPIAALNIKFDQAELRVPAGTALTIVFDNQDAGIPHNVAIYSDSSGSNKLFGGEIFPGPGTRSYAVPALPPGTYFFRCDVHPTVMTGTFIAG